MMHSAYFTNDKNPNSETNELKKTNHSSPYFLALQGSYPSLELALFHGDTVLNYEKNAEKKASAELIPFIETFLNNHNLKITDLSFIAVDQGPGAFTSLRVAIATVNGLAFASGVPLIGIDGLDALAHEIKGSTPAPKYGASLLNAFNGELYFGLYSFHERTEACIAKGYDKIEKVISTIEEKISNLPLTIAGNGIGFCKELLETSIGNRLTLFENLTTASAQQIGRDALALWKNESSGSFYLKPLYLKTQQFKPKYS